MVCRAFHFCSFIQHTVQGGLSGIANGIKKFMLPATHSDFLRTHSSNNGEPNTSKDRGWSLKDDEKLAKTLQQKEEQEFEEEFGDQYA